MTPLQSFNLIDRLSKSLIIMDENGRANPEYNSYMLWFDEWKIVRDNIFLALETVKQIEVKRACSEHLTGFNCYI